jgi:hypothetical protein
MGCEEDGGDRGGREDGAAMEEDAALFLVEIQNSTFNPFP